MAELSREYLTLLFRGLEEQFNLSELQTLCFHLGVEFEDLAGAGKEDKVRELLLHLKRRGQMGALLEYCAAERPNFSWQPTEPADIQALVEENPLDLTFLQDFLGPVLQKTDEALHQPASATIAKERAFALYEVLGEVELGTEEFVEALRTFAEAVAQAAPHTADAQATLVAASSALMGLLPQVAEALNAVNPQLGIHQHELVQRIERYRRSRMRLLTELETQASTAGEGQAEKLQPLVQRAEANSVMIKEAITQLRVFLAAQFPFKDSF